MNIAKNEALAVRGARLYYEVQGAGPLLLLIAGSEGGAGAFTDLADRLAADYTVVSYDRRGAARSPVDDDAEEVSNEMHADDASCLLANLTAEPAYVFGTNSGALVGLDLAIRHPNQVRTLIAHEPPAIGVLPEFDRFSQAAWEAYQSQGAVPAFLGFVTQIGLTFDDLEPGVTLPPLNEQVLIDRAMRLWRFSFPAAHKYRLDQPALKAAPTRIVFGGASGGRDYPVYRETVLLAQCLGMPFVEFPGHHAGYINYPSAFGNAIRAVLGQTPEQAVPGSLQSQSDEARA